MVLASGGPDNPQIPIQKSNLISLETNCICFLVYSTLKLNKPITKPDDSLNIYHDGLIDIHIVRGFPPSG